MMHRLVQRTLSIGLAALLTVAMLGGIDHLAVTDAPAAGWATQVNTTPRA